MKSSRIFSLKRIVLASTAVAALLPTYVVMAADNASAPETIIVTAQRRAESLPDVPITITNLDAGALTRGGANSLQDISQMMAGVRFDNSGGSTQATIRGVGTQIALAGAASNVGIYVDGFNSPNPLSSDFQLVTVENVQILKGPQGTLFGRNTTGGAILVTTAKPSTTTRAVVEASYGSYNAHSFQGYFTTGLTSKIAWDVAAVYSGGDGFHTNIATGDDKVGAYKNWSIRTGINFDISDNFSALLRYQHDHKDDPQDVLYSPYNLNGVPYVSAAVTRPAGVFIATRPGDVAIDDRVENKTWADSFQLTLNWDLDFATLTSYSQYRKDKVPGKYGSLDFTNQKLTTLGLIISDLTITQEILLASKPGSRLQYVAGLFYFDYRDNWLAITGIGANPFIYNLASGSNPTSTAAFADVTYEVVDNLFITGGLRYTRDVTRNAYFQTATARTVLPNLKTNRVTPRAVVRYALDSGSNVYASYSKGYKAAIYNVGGASAIPIRPESLDAFEIGYKQARGGVALNLSGYYYNYKDQQLATASFVNGVPRSVLTNAAASRIYGVDADIRFQITPEFDVNAAASWIHARYKSFPNAPRFSQNANGTYNLNGAINATGFHMVRSPEFTAVLGARYMTDLAGGELALSGNLYYTSKFYFDLTEQLPSKSYATLAVRAEWTDPSDRYTIAVYGNNITNSHYYSQARTSGNGMPSVWAWPATFGGSIRARF